MAQSEMTVVELREWLRGWVCRATGLDVSKVTDDRSLEEFGLSSKDAVTLSADLEDEPLLASEMVIDGPCGGPGSGDQLGDRHAGHPVDADQFGRRFDDRVPSVR